MWKDSLGLEVQDNDDENLSSRVDATANWNLNENKRNEEWNAFIQKVSKPEIAAR